MEPSPRLATRGAVDSGVIELEERRRFLDAPVRGEWGIM
jgi:hypothetical protein